MRFGRATAGIAVVGLVVAVMVLAGARRPKVIVVDGFDAGPNATPECPHKWPLRAVRPRKYLPGDRIDVPEFHDCQRLRDSSGAYGALAAVFARDSLEDVTDTALMAQQGVAVALVHLPDDPDPGFAHQYPALGLTRPFACVMVRRAQGADRAWIVPVDDGTACATATPPPPVEGVGPFDLHVLTSPLGDPRTIPPVARWDWDSTTKTQYIGVRCGTAWCEIGVKGFKSSAEHDPGAAAGPDRAGYALRGSYDEQRLAEFRRRWSFFGPPRLVPSLNLGTVVPAADLPAFTASTPEAGEWEQTARVHVGPRAGSYTSKFNFAVSTVSPTDDRTSTVWLCVWTRAKHCPAMEENTTLDVSRCSVTPGTEERWISRVDRPGSRTQYYCVVYRKHEGSFKIPPVVRWRWRADDETIWISCPSGCCEVKAKR